MLARSASKLVEMQETLRATADVIESQPVTGEVPSSFERFVLKHGRAYSSAKLTPKEKAIVEAAIARRRAGGRTFEKRRCYENSQHLMMSDETQKLTYVEGYAWMTALRVLVSHNDVLKGIARLVAEAERE